jgi:hypothetical protein
MHATPYFSGMMPSDMEKYHSDLWVREDVEDGKNNFEDKFLERQLKKLKLNLKWSYHKIKKYLAGQIAVGQLQQSAQQ